MPLSTGAGAFWLAAALMAGVALAFVLAPLVGRSGRRNGVTRAAVNAGIYRAQLAELDQALSAGVLSAAEHRACTDDILCRVPTDVLKEGPRTDLPRRRWPALALALALPALATGLYLSIGNPASLHPQDSVAATAPGARPMRAELPERIARLEAQLAHAPADGRAWVMLARANFELDRFADAARAYERALGASRKVADDPQIWCELADALGMAQGGSLKGRPRELIDKALALNANHLQALEMAGSAEYEAGNYARALVHWEGLLAVMSAEARARRELEIAIARVRRLAASGGNPS